jgi:hypothetical protein
MTGTAGTALLPVVATSARNLGQYAGTCPVCGYGLYPAERVADLPDGSVVHVAGCAARAGSRP